MSSARTVQFLADTSVLICFGALPGGGGMFSNAFGGNVAATPAIRRELARKAGSGNRHVMQSAGVFSGKHSARLLDEALLACDVPERDTALDHITRHATPTGPAATLDSSPEGMEPAASKHVEHGGEAEIIAVSVRQRLPLLMNDRDGTNYAKERGLSVEPFSASLRRLIGRHSAQELLRMWRDVAALHDTGYVVSGPGFFQQPAATAKLNRSDAS